MTKDELLEKQEEKFKYSSLAYYNHTEITILIELAYAIGQRDIIKSEYEAQTRTTNKD